MHNAFKKFKLATDPIRNLTPGKFAKKIKSTVNGKSKQSYVFAKHKNKPGTDDKLRMGSVAIVLFLRALCGQPVCRQVMFSSNLERVEEKKNWEGGSKGLSGRTHLGRESKNFSGDMSPISGVGSTPRVR